MTLRSARVALLFSILPVAGCGTAANLCNSRVETGGHAPFGGVKHDLACIRGAYDDGPHARKRAADGEEQYQRATLGLVCAADLPLSFAADVVLWPYTKTYTRLNQPVPYPPIVIGETPPVQGTQNPPVAVTPAIPIPIPPAAPAAETPPAAPPATIPPATAPTTPPATLPTTPPPVLPTPPVNPPTGGTP